MTELPVQAKSERSIFLVADGHVYQRIEVPNTKPRQWRLVELELRRALDLMIHDCQQLVS